MAGAQFIGKERLLAAFERRGGGAWQLVQGKKLCATGDGSTELEEWIDIFAGADSRSPYTLQLYGDMEPGDITKGTHPEASWDFMIHETRPAGSAVSGTMGVVSKLQQKIDDRIAEKIGALIDKDDEPEEAEGIDINAIINHYAHNPEKLGQAVGAIQGIFGMLKNMLGMNGQQQATGAIGSVFQPDTPRHNVNQATGYPEGTVERLTAVLDILGKRDPKLLEHLEKLAAMDDFTLSLILAKLDAL